ncbi:hypothetical protein HDK77DRAFT_438087 [Phyllosticta capitalensis]
MDWTRLEDRWLDMVTATGAVVWLCPLDLSVSSSLRLSLLYLVVCRCLYYLMCEYACCYIPSLVLYLLAYLLACFLARSFFTALSFCRSQYTPCSPPSSPFERVAGGLHR